MTSYVIAEHLGKHLCADLLVKAARIAKEREALDDIRDERSGADRNSGRGLADLPVRGERRQLADG